MLGDFYLHVTAQVGAASVASSVHRSLAAAVEGTLGNIGAARGVKASV